jgi:predicted metalloprotease with PDZ domain
MTAVDINAAGFGWYEADDYDELVDHPVEMGEFTTIAFEAAGTPHALVIRGRHQADQERLTRDLSRLCTHQIEFFGKPAPMPRYLFLLHATGEGYGGLEHRASSALIINRDALPRLHEKADYPNEDYREFLGLCSHEYFHTWNVKRIRPAAFIGADIGQEAYTRLLWAFEGITSYYDELFLLRCGLIRAEDYLTLLARAITRVYRTPGRHRQSLAEASFDAWIKFYKPDENAPNAQVSYYAKGALVALALDLSLRAATEQRVGLDTVMCELWRRHGQAGIGVPEDGIERLAAELSGRDWRDFFARYVEGVEDPPLAELLAEVGIRLSWTAARSAQDLGGYGEADATEPARGCTLGIKTNGSEGGVRVVQVYTDGCALQAGIAAGDMLIAWDGLRLDGDCLNRALKRAEPGQEILLHGFRGDQLMQFTVRLQALPADTCRLSWITTADVRQLEARSCWLQTMSAAS